LAPPSGELSSVSETERVRLSSPCFSAPTQIQRAAPGNKGEEAENSQKNDESRHQEKRGLKVGAKVGDIFLMGHKVYRAHLIAVQINGGRAKDSSVLDGGGDVLLKVVGEGHLVR